MSLLLSIETSTSTCSVALQEEGILLNVVETLEPRAASSQLAVMIEQVLAQSGKKSTSLSGVVVAAGPGSYTGLRIGVATAKGICYALSIPLLSVNTLKLLGYQFIQSTHERDKGAVFCPMLDARRMEVYCMLLNDQLIELEATQAKVIDAESFKEVLEKGNVYFFGDGALKCKEIITHPNAHFISGIVPSAAPLAELGCIKWKANQFENVAAFEPFYLKDFLIRKPNVE